MREHKTPTVIITRFKKIVLFGLLPVLILIIIITGTAGYTAYSMQNFTKKMSAYHYGLNLPNSIDVIESVRIGGIDQGISIRGYNKDAPILLFLHGGPGSHMIRFEHEVASMWEEYFTVVFWDQRGAGKSYHPTSEIGETMIVEQMLEDTSEMIDYLRNRFNRKKIFVAGHSWGSVLGIHMAKQHPDWLYAYVGIGQVVNSAESKQKTAGMLLELFEENGDRDGVQTLKTMVPFSDPDISVETYYKNWSVVQRMLVPFGLNEYHQMRDPDKIQLFLLSTLLSSSTVSLTEIYRDIFSDDNPSTLASLREGVRQTDIPTQVGFDFDVPIFFVSGKYDWQVHYKLSTEYFDRINAPYKEILILDNSAHVPYIDEPGRFLNFMVNRVLPAASF